MLQPKATNAKKDKKGITSLKSRSNRYRQHFLIGRGGFGDVVAATDLATHEMVAIKRIKSVSLLEKQMLEFLQNKVSRQRASTTVDIEKVTSGFKPDNADDVLESNYVVEYKESFIVDIYDDDEKKANFNLQTLFTKAPDRRELWLVQEYCEAGDLANIMRDSSRPFSLTVIKHVVANLVLGLKFIHSRGIVHKDLKCLNILMTRSGRVKICDFGKAEFCDRTKQHDFLENIATDLWMAPEMFRDQARYGFEVDIWALGITMIEMYRINPPFSEMQAPMNWGTILNLADANNQEQRQMLGLPNPPKMLLENSKGKNNNYHDFNKLFDFEPRKEEEKRVQKVDSEVEVAGLVDDEEILELNVQSKLRFSEDGYTELAFDESFQNFDFDEEVLGKSSTTLDSRLNDDEADENLPPKKRNSLPRETQITAAVSKHTSVPGKTTGTTNSVSAEDNESVQSGKSIVYLDEVKKKKKSLSNLYKSLKTTRGNMKKKSNDLKSKSDDEVVDPSTLQPTKNVDSDIDETPEQEKEALLSKLKVNLAKKRNERKSQEQQRLKPGRETKTKVKGNHRRSSRFLGINLPESIQKISKALRVHKTKRTRSSIRKQKQKKKKMLEKKKRLDWEKRHSYVNLAKCTEEEIFFEFVAWCLSTVQKNRPTANELTEHPFIEKSVNGLIKSEGSDCTVRFHSDYSNNFHYGSVNFGRLGSAVHAENIVDKDKDEKESDDEDEAREVHELDFLEEAQNKKWVTKDDLKQYKESLAKRQNSELERDLCTCSEAQIYLRHHVAEPAIKERRRRPKKAL